MPIKIPSDYLESADFAVDPYRLNGALREQAPVHPIDFPPGASAFLVVGYEQVRAAFLDLRISKDLRHCPGWFRERLLVNSPVLASNMMTSDPPEHTRLRRLVARELTPRRVQDLEPRIREVTEGLIDALPASGEFDLMERFCVSLPLIVVCELLGVPVEDRPLFRTWTSVLLGSAYVQGELAERRRQVSTAMADYLSDLIARRRREPLGDLTSALVKGADAEDGWKHSELVSTLVTMLIAGHETTVHLFGNGMAALLLDDERRRELAANPSLMPNAVEEFLRYDGPVERGTLRFASEDMEIAGVKIPYGSFIHLSVGAADRDPAEFPDPDRLDLHRATGSHIAFGHGAHFCLGAPLARLEGQIGFEALLRRLPGLNLAVPADELRWIRDSSVVHGLEALPVRLGG